MAIGMNKSIVILGSSGLIGSQLTTRFQNSSFQVIPITKKDCDLTNIDEVKRTISGLLPCSIICAAGVVGGISSNIESGWNLGIENALITSNVLKVAYELGIDELIYFGCGCCYPNNISRPMKPDDIWDGPIEPTSRAYSLSKLIGVELVSQARSSGLSWTTVIPSNVYGPHDDYSLERAHVVPALLRRVITSIEKKQDVLTLMGDGSAIRQFIHSSDVASAIEIILANLKYADPIINIATPDTCTIKELANLIAHVSAYAGEIIFSGQGANGTPIKVLDGSHLISMGWKSEYDLERGLSHTYRWLTDNLGTKTVRGWG